MVSLSSYSGVDKSNVGATATIIIVVFIVGVDRTDFSQREYNMFGEKHDNYEYERYFEHFQFHSVPTLRTVQQ